MTLPMNEGLSSSSPARAAELVHRKRPAKPTPSAACTSMVRPSLRSRFRICGITLIPEKPERFAPEGSLKDHADPVRLCFKYGIRALLRHCHPKPIHTIGPPPPQQWRHRPS